MARRRISLPLRRLADPGEDGPSRYECLAEELRRLILCGSVGPARQIPSERELAREFAVSRNTVAAAIALLVEEGLLERRPSSGTYVADPIPAHLVPIELAAQRARTTPDPARSATPRPLAPCVASTEIFPRPRWARLLAQAASGPHGTAPPPPGGLPETRAAIAAYVSQARGARCAPEQVVVLSSLRAGYALLARLLLASGDMAAIEDPCDPALPAALQVAGALPQPLAPGTVFLDSIRTRGARLAVVEPTQHYPTGHSLDLAARAALLDWAASNNGWVLELDRGSELRHAGRPLAPLQAIDQQARVVQLGSFDHTLFSGIGVAYAIAPPPLAASLADAAAAAGAEPPAVLQAAFAAFVDRGHVTAHLLRLAPLYRERRAALLEGLRPLEDAFEIGSAEAGLHVPLFARQPVDDVALAMQAARRGLGVLPFSALCIARPVPGLVVGYAGVSAMGIRSAARTLADLLPRRVAA
jgi:GntR family transcriptional regulator / MocR family aminotransferase